MTIQDHVEEVNFAVSDIGNSDIYIGHDWLKRHNPTIDWNKSRILMNRCPHRLQVISDIEQLTKDETQHRFYPRPQRRTSIFRRWRSIIHFDVNGYLENNRQYDYVLKYDPTKSKRKAGPEHRTEAISDYEDLFNQEGFQQTPRMTTMDHAIDLTPGFKPVDCKTYNLSPQEQEKTQGVY